MTTGGNTGPLIPRRRLGAALRELREGRPETLQETAKALMFSPSKLSRIENGLAGEPHPRDVRDLIAHFRIAGTTAATTLESLAAEGRRPGWWQVSSYPMPKRLDTLISYESAASRIEAYVPLVVPGMLQTPAYAAAVLHSLAPHLSADQLEDQVALRMRRQRELRGRAHPPVMCLTVPETVLHRVVGSPAVMREQIQAILAAEPAVDLHVVPFAVGLYQATETATTTLFHFENSLDPDVVSVETLTSIQFIDGEDRIRRYREALAELADIRLNREQSRDFVARFQDHPAWREDHPE